MKLKYVVITSVTRDDLPVARFVPPEDFNNWRDTALEMGLNMSPAARLYAALIMPWTYIGIAGNLE